MNPVARLLEPGTPSAVGSLPHTDAGEAARLAITLHPELPAAPQLPNRTAKEGMLAQVAVGIAGITIDDHTGLITKVDRRRLQAPADDADLDADAWGGTLAFLQTAAALRHQGPIKLQVTGPVTLGLALVHAGAKPAKAFAVASAATRHAVKHLVARAHDLIAEPKLLVVLDEPGLTAYPTPGFPLAADETIDLLSGGMAAAGPNAMVGVHCCGPTDWRLVLHAGPDLISAPVDAQLTDDAGGLANFLDRGGWVAWGAVPTDRPIGERDEPHWRRLSDLWSDLARNGCDPMRLRTQAIVTPACGLALHHPSQVGTIYRLVRRLAERVQDQAIAARMSAGA